MTTSFLSTVVQKLQRLRSGVGNAHTHHEQMVQFWMLVVVGTIMGITISTLLSLSMWWVQPQANELNLDEPLPEERPLVKEGEYDVVKAEKILKLFEERKEK